MNLSIILPKIISELRRQRDSIDEAIKVLERLLATNGRRPRGRPPGWLKALRDTR
jgi:hypothetical protein